MLPDPTERNVNPLLFQTGIHTVKELVLTLTIHDKNDTVTKTARAYFTVRTGLALPFEGRMRPKTHRNNELRSPNPSKQRPIIAVPTNTRVPSPIKVLQVRSRWHLSLSTPRLHQGCDSPPHTSKQWPAQLASLWPDSEASPVRVRTSTRGITRDRPRCVVRSLLNLISCSTEGGRLKPKPTTPQRQHTPNSTATIKKKKKKLKLHSSQR